MTCYMQEGREVSLAMITFFQEVLVIDNKLGALVLKADQIEQLMTEHHVAGIRTASLSKFSCFIGVFKTDTLHLLVS